MKLRLFLVAIVLGIGAFIFFDRGDPAPEKSPSPSEKKVTLPKKVTVLEDTPFAREFGKTETSPARELALIQLAFQDYLSFVKPAYRQPIGDNRDFTALLTGGNPYKIAPISPDHSRINESGELTDRRGIPFVVHPISEEAIEVRAAGEDGEIWTDDDLVDLSPRGQTLRPRVLGE